MSMLHSGMDRLEVRANWVARPMTFLEFSSNVVELIRRLRQLSPALRDWAIRTNKKPWFVAWDGQADTLWTQLVASNFFPRNKRHEVARGYRENSLNKGSFRARLQCTSAGAGPFDHPEDGGLTLDIDCGAVPLAPKGMDLWRPESWLDSERLRTRSRAVCLLRLPADHEGPTHAPDIVRGMLEAVTSTWQSPRGAVGSFEFLNQAYGMAPFDREQRATGGQHKVWQGWMSYFQLPNLATRLSEAGADITALGADACLLFTKRDRVMASQPESIAAARELDALLAALCINQDEVLIDGWPHDPAELRYAIQCGAAPRKPAPRVGLAAFSVWDEPRQTLIYARLFRGESVDDLAYLPATFNQTIDGMRPVAEARRQLRSLALTGSRAAIEWHIGREEIVEPLRTLLHRHAGIDEARLRVVSTPYLA